MVPKRRTNINAKYRASAAKSARASRNQKQHRLENDRARYYKMNECICYSKNRACDWDLLAIYSNLKQEIGGDNPLCPPFRCGLCPFATLAPDALKQHMMTHVVERPYRCPICGKGFTQKGSVQLHMLHHTGERPHKCPVCQRSYSQKGSMRRHILQHLPPDCQRCPLCSASRFPLRADLETHLIQHTKKDSCRCDRCNATFTSDALLAEHARLHHSTSEDTTTSA